MVSYMYKYIWSKVNMRGMVYRHWSMLLHLHVLHSKNHFVHTVYNLVWIIIHLVKIVQYFVKSWMFCAKQFLPWNISFHFFVNFLKYFFSLTNVQQNFTFRKIKDEIKTETQEAFICLKKTNLLSKPLMDILEMPLVLMYALLWPGQSNKWCLLL